VARKAQRPPHNLPAELTSFVGQRAVLAEMTGTGGVGKTRLAIRAGVDVLRAPSAA
jgi:hypothetical protein